MKRHERLSRCLKSAGKLPSKRLRKTQERTKILQFTAEEGHCGNFLGAEMLDFIYNENTMKKRKL